MKYFKTYEEKIAKPSSFLILLGVLKGYLNKPLIILIITKITFKKFKRKVKLELPADFIDNYAFIAWLYIRLKRKVGHEKAFEILRAGILTSGLAVQQANFRNVEAGRSFDNLKRYQQKANREGSTKLNSIEIIEETDHKFEFRVTRCLFFELFNSLDVQELTSIMCSIDNAIFNSYLPERIVFHRNGLYKTIFHGNKYCEFVLENKDLLH
jgi:hypothetical protein